MEVRKRAKRDTADGHVWGEEVPQSEKASHEFLYSGLSSQGRATGQSELRVVSGLECREILKGVANLAVEVAGNLEAAGDWEEWVENEN